MNILHLTSSPRGEASVSIKLGNAIVEKLRSSSNEPSSVKTRNLASNPFPHLEEVHLNSFFTPVENHTPEQAAAVKHSDQAIAEIREANVIVIGVPMYNFGIHSTLKAWIDHIARAGQTFKYTDKGPVGLIENKKVYLAIATGGIYSQGTMKAFDFTEPYLRAVFGLLGMSDIIAFRAEGINLPTVGEKGLIDAIEGISL